MEITKLSIFCFLLLQSYIEAFQSSSQQRQHLAKDDKNKNIYGNYHPNSIARLNEKVNKFQKEFKSTSSLVIPPYLKKRNRRLKALYESMHRVDEQPVQKKTYGYMEYQKMARRLNDVPENDIYLSQKKQPIRQIDNNFLLHRKHSKSHHNKKLKIKKLRFKPEVGIMQKTMRKN